MVLGGLTHEDVCEAVERVRIGPDLSARAEAVSRTVLRRRRAITRVREQEERYSASPGKPAPDSREH